MKPKTAAIFLAATFAVAVVGAGGAWYAYKNAMIQRDIRSRVMHVDDALSRLTALAQRASAPQAAPAPPLERVQLEAIAEMARQARDAPVQLEAIAEMARQARDSALMARLAATQNAAPSAPDRARCDGFVESLAASAAGRSSAYGAFVGRFLAICASNRDASVFDALERALGPAP